MNGSEKGLVRGWCPGALRPMPSGDGLVLRVRPHAGRLVPAQALALAALAEAEGNGLVDLGTRAHVQLRGLTGAGLPAAHAVLAELGLLDPDPAAEAKRNILTTPVWEAGDGTLALVAALEASLADAPALPPKFGFAVDTGPRAVLGAASADIRIERGPEGLILRADGAETGAPVTAAEAPALAVALARWFAESGGREAGRMARHLAAGAALPAWAQGDARPLAGPALRPGPHPLGFCLALPFGQMRAATLRRLAIAPLRLTPWRSVLVEGLAAPPADPGLIADPAEPLLRVAACTGAPGCPAASVGTRGLARRLAALLPPEAELHVSGCAKGCARPGPATLTLTGREGRFDLIRNGPPWAAPEATDLGPDDIPALLTGARLAPRL